MKGGKGRNYRIYSTPYIHDLNEKHKELYGTPLEPNFQLPAKPGDELIGLEFLFSQSTGGEFDPGNHYAKTVEDLGKHAYNSRVLMWDTKSALFVHTH